MKYINQKASEAYHSRLSKKQISELRGACLTIRGNQENVARNIVYVDGKGDAWYLSSSGIPINKAMGIFDSALKPYIGELPQEFIDNPRVQLWEENRTATILKSVRRLCEKI